MTKLSRTQAQAIVAELLEARRAMIRVYDELIDSIQAIAGGTRVVRNYDVPTPDPEEIAAQYGVDLTDDPEQEMPEWVAARIAKHLPESTP